MKQLNKQFSLSLRHPIIRQNKGVFIFFTALVAEATTGKGDLVDAQRVKARLCHDRYLLS